VADGRYVMGIDYGTGGVRVGLFERDGAPVAFHAVEFPTSHDRPGWAEQDPGEWWSALTQAVPGALRDSGVAPEDIAGISVDATSSTVLAVDADGRPLRPAIMWMDVRASDQAERVAATGHPALKYNGFGAVSAEWGLPKALWIKESEPEVFAAARYLVDCADWVTHRLTGTWSASINTASSKYYYDRDQGGWPERLYDEIGGGDVLERFPDEVLDLGAPVGELRQEIAGQLGLAPGTPVAEGSVDAYAGALGLGVVEPGTLALITGSSHCLIAQSAAPVHDPGFWGAYTDAMIPGLYTIEAGQAATGSIVAWFKNRFAGDVVAEAQRRGVDPYELLTEMARAVPVGSEGVLVLDYFQGNPRRNLGALAWAWARARLPRHHRVDLLRH
jgi:ribulose kinase